LSALGFLRKLFRPRPKSDLFSHYFALGDSISTDDYPGVGKGAASLFYKNQDPLYSEFKGKDLLSLSAGIHFRCIAKDGATSYDVLHRQLLELPTATSAPTLFTLTAGGNDILFMQSDPEEIIFRIQTILNQIKRLFPHSVLILGTIYDPTDGTGELHEQGVPLLNELDTLTKTNHAIRAMAEPGRIYIADIHAHFLGHGSEPKELQNTHRQTDLSLWYVMTIEPNSRGAHEIRRLFWQCLDQHLNEKHDNF
jgi:hypothetical protein